MVTKASPRKLKIEIGWATIFRILLGVLLGWAALKLWPTFKLLLLAILIAVALYPIVMWCCRRGWPRWVGLLLATATLLVIVFGFLGLLGPLVVSQGSALVHNLPKISEEALSHLPATGPVREALNPAKLSDSQQVLGKGLLILKSSFGGLLDMALLLVFAVYFMVDGNRTVKWLEAFFRREQRQKIRRALPEIREVIVAYVVGQFITSALCAIYVFLVLTFLHVPMAALLGIAAGIFDILPIIGFILAVLPAMAVGLTVSPLTSLIILGLYSAYHLFENYVIVPRVYGHKLKLSMLAVLLAIVAGAALAGVVGAIIILPIVASYPVIEKVWLAPLLEPDTVERHQKEPDK